MIKPQDLSAAPSPRGPVAPDLSPGQISQQQSIDRMNELMRQHEEQLGFSRQATEEAARRQQAQPSAPVAPSPYGDPAAMARQNELLAQHQTQLGLSQQLTNQLNQRNALQTDPTIQARLNELQMGPVNTQNQVAYNTYKNELAAQYPDVFAATGQTNQDIVNARAANSAGVRNAQAALDQSRAQAARAAQTRAQQYRQFQAPGVAPKPQGPVRPQQSSSNNIMQYASYVPKAAGLLGGVGSFLSGLF